VIALFDAVLHQPAARNCQENGAVVRRDAQSS
jgi:hypothetical protein